MAMRRVGRAGDGGVDLRGWWHLPGDRRVEVIAQCKAERKPLGPRALRELEGSAGHGVPDLSILLSQSGFSSHSLSHAARSRIPLMLLHLPGEENDVLMAESTWWNTAWKDRMNGRMELRREYIGSRAETRIVYDGQPLIPDA